MKNLTLVSPCRIEKEIARIRQEGAEAKQQGAHGTKKSAARNFNAELCARIKQQQVTARTAARAQKASEQKKFQLKIQRQRDAAQAENKTQTRGRLKKDKPTS